VSAGPLASLRRAVHPDDTLQVLPGGIVGRWTGRMAAAILTQSAQARSCRGWSMPTTAKRGPATSRVRRAAVPLLLLALIAAMAAPAARSPGR
jgi:hypothetical protein